MMTTPGDMFFPDTTQRIAWEDALTRDLAAARENVATGPVTPDKGIEAFRETLAEFDFAAPRSLEDACRWTIGQMSRGMVHMTHPAHFGLFNPAPTFPSECADRVASAFNAQLAVWSHAPVPVEIEAHTIRAVATRIGLEAGSGGHFTSGGAEANFTSLISALTAANARFADEGVHAFPGRPVFYASAESHLAWLKIGHQAGIGRTSVRLVATDGSGRMDADALAAAVAEDRRQGHVPVMIAATAGTTNAGMVDPLAACARIARDEKLWFHVDAAWGGALAASDRLRHALDGIGEADSVTVDAHKWFATTMGCGMFLTRRPEILSQVFQVSASYMPSNVVSLDPYVNSMQWSRRFLGIRLFLSLASMGWAGYAAHVERAVDLSALLGRELGARGWRIANASPVAVLCVTPPPGRAPVTEVARRVVETGEAWVSSAKLEGEDVLRACITNGGTTEAHIDALATLLERVSAG